MTSMNRIVRSGMLAAGLAAGFVLAMPAEAASTYEAEVDLTLTVVDAGRATITGDTNPGLFEVDGIESFSAIARIFQPVDPMPLSAGGDPLKMYAGVSGQTLNGFPLSSSTTTVAGDGSVRVETETATSVEFFLAYALSGSATIDDATVDAAFVNVLLEISTLSGSFSLSKTVTVDLPAGGPSGFNSLSGNIPVTLGLDDLESDEIYLSVKVTGTATTLAPVPLPAALPLFAAGLAAVGLAARRRNRR